MHRKRESAVPLRRAVVYELRADRLLADIVAYRCAAVSEDEPLDIALVRVDTLVDRILNQTASTDYECYLSGTDNFRYNIYPEYKANRTQQRPKWLEQCREHLVVTWGAVVTEGYEADDAIGIAATDLKQTPYVICSIDKDLKQIEGNHFNFVTLETSYVDPIDGIKMFYKQMLIGDTADNIRGVTGIGKVKAGRAIDPLNTEEDMFDLVRNLYNDDERFLLNGKLLWILRTEGGIWPNGRLLDLRASSSPHSEVPQDDIPQSMNV